MSEDMLRQGVVGNDTPSTTTAEAIGAAAKRMEDIADEMRDAKASDTARFEALADEQKAQAAILGDLKEKHDEEVREEKLEGAAKAAAEWTQFAKTYREPSKARDIGGGGRGTGHIGTGFSDENAKGAFLFGVFQANSRDTEMQREGKAILAALAGKGSVGGAVTPEGKAVLEAIDGTYKPDAKAYDYERSWGKATLGTTDALGGWIIPNAIVDEFITPGTVTNIYRQIMTVVSGVTATGIDIPYRSAPRARAVIAPWGDTKENLNLAYGGYTATMFTLARIYDLSNQFLRTSRGAAEADVLSELAAAFAQGESYYIREGTGSTMPYGYTPALTNGPAAFQSTFSSPSDSTLAGSIASAISVAAGALAGRGSLATGAVLSATAYWNMLRQGSDAAGFWFTTNFNNPSSIAPNTLISPFGIPVYADADANLEGTAAVADNLVVANWKKFKVYFGESYRVDSSDQAGTRWDTNLTGFRGEEEMGFDARPVVYAGHAQLITDVIP